MAYEIKIKSWYDEAALAKRLTSIFDGDARNCIYLEDPQKWMLGSSNDWWLRKYGQCEGDYLLTARYAMDEEKEKALKVILAWLVGVEIW